MCTIAIDVGSPLDTGSLITEGAAATRLGLPVSTLQNWRELGRGPIAYQVNETKCMYLESDIRIFESICLDSFHDLRGHDRSKGVVEVGEENNFTGEIVR